VAIGFAAGGVLNVVGFVAASVGILLVSSLLLLATLGWTGWRVLAGDTPADTAAAPSAMLRPWNSA
jgi:hypothetical protein